MHPALPEISRAELSAVVRAVRVRPSRDKELRAAAVTFATFLLISLHSASLAAWNPSQAPVGAQEENQMLSLRHIAVVSSLAVSSSALAQNAVQWRTEDGGNGHWYSIVASGLPFHAAKTQAESVGAHLCTITSAAEQQFIATSVASGTSFLNAWIGLAQDPASAEPAGGWRWVTGELLGPYANWWPAVPQPDDSACGTGVAEDFAMWAKQWGGFWADVSAGTVPGVACTGEQSHAILEWSADCNNDGIVDFGQIRDGTLADTNANNVPDCCESSQGCNPCPADVDGSGAVNGVDLAAILNVWGTSGGKYPGADVNRDGIVDGSDLAEVLNGWGACP